MKRGLEVEIQLVVLLGWLLYPLSFFLFFPYIYKMLNNSPAMWPMWRIFPKAEEMYVFFTIWRFYLFLKSHFFILHVHRFYLNWHIPWKMILFIKLDNKSVVLFKFQLQHCTALNFSSCETDGSYKTNRNYFYAVS